jgi:hypothetical protein
MWSNAFMVAYKKYETNYNFSVKTVKKCMFYKNFVTYNYEPLPITITERSKAWTVFARSNAGVVGSNPTQSMEVLPTILGIRNWSETKRFTDSQCPRVRATGKREREWYEPLYKVFLSMALPAHSGPWPFIQFRNHFSQTVGLPGRVISPSQGRYLYTGQHKHRINAYTHQTSMPWVGFKPTIPTS